MIILLAAKTKAGNFEFPKFKRYSKSREKNVVTAYQQLVKAPCCRWMYFWYRDTAQTHVQSETERERETQTHLLRTLPTSFSRIPSSVSGSTHTCYKLLYVVVYTHTHTHTHVIGQGLKFDSTAQYDIYIILNIKLTDAQCTICHIQKYEMPKSRQIFNWLCLFCFISSVLRPLEETNESLRTCERSVHKCTYLWCHAAQLNMNECYLGLYSIFSNSYK